MRTSATGIESVEVKARLVRREADRFVVDVANAPAAIGKEDDYVLQTRKLSAERIARQNPAFDTDRDGRITAGEFRRRLPKLFPDEFRSILF